MKRIYITVHPKEVDEFLNKLDEAKENELFVFSDIAVTSRKEKRELIWNYYYKRRVLLPKVVAGQLVYYRGNFFLTGYGQYVVLDRHLRFMYRDLHAITDTDAYKLLKCEYVYQSDSLDTNFFERALKYNPSLLGKLDREAIVKSLKRGFFPKEAFNYIDKSKLKPRDWKLILGCK